MKRSTVLLAAVTLLWILASPAMSADFPMQPASSDSQAIIYNMLWYNLSGMAGAIVFGCRSARVF